MKRLSRPTALFFCVLGAVSPPATAAPPAAAPAKQAEIAAQERTLANGMRLLLYPRKDEPTVAGGWVAHVGSANERPGITGISHLFEHMMFKGTKTIGTTDYAKDLEVIAEQEKVRQEMRDEMASMRLRMRQGEIDDIAKPESKTARYKELEARFDELIKEQRKILVKNEFDRLYTSQGGSGMNAFTNSDITAYFITVPKNKLELWMLMESDRLLNPVFREFYSERDVVFEERRLRTESTPTGRLDEAFEAMFWHSHPYSWPVVGYPSDIPAISKAQADEYFSLFYAPNNLTAILVGDFDVNEAVALAEKYFGRIPRGKVAPPEMTTLPPKWEAEMRFNGEAETNPQVSISWHTVAFKHKDSYALQVLADLLNGRTGRLYKSLVAGTDPVATESRAAQQTRKYAGELGVDAEVKDGKTPEEVEKRLLGEIERLKTELVPADELQKVKNNSSAATFRRLTSNSAILFQLIRGDGFGDWHEVNDGPKRLEAVTAEDVRRVAQTYLTKENRGVAVYTRKAAAPGKTAAADDLSDIPEPIRPAARQIDATTDVAKLQQMVSNMEQRSGQVPPEMKKGFDLLLGRARARLAELTKSPLDKPAADKK